jgi:hypothetical protein
MSTALSKAIAEVGFRIPKPILEAVFITRNIRWRQTPESLETHILNEVVRPRVLVDCNLSGGAQVLVPLIGLMPERTQDFSSTYAYSSVYRIPKDRTNGRSIMSVLLVTFGDTTKSSLFNGGMQYGANTNTMLAAGGAVMDAMGNIPITSTARVQLIGENVVLVRDVCVLPPNIHLRCIIANDENMSHLQLKSYRDFSNLVVMAVKAYIFNQYIIQMDIGELHGGQNLGRFKEIIDGYSEAEELYQTFLREKWDKIALMNDAESYTRFLKTVIGGNH